ncbi:uncharacterized protein SPPG_04728 [Spizellomyces punctatus DAOM BR117]|uniref:Coiled-coil domain-containing protein 112 n=1 Tax=Spizellomyces punctatus (strain DAOM BR117) TaxID=645134 RepID=A0A0L0HHR4_SPIPD|nr:uncharacterized protein SPPG_04728 [Spizellomyces punctatus DAOM BR117]KND00405.1 hypothetical protein SPPG_04728 [Spizellomyces punctatus DAOM BR117]|eukprot:XP_016608444.1 hypothetical protein SPPG_04728 [Spizellomyces punctatus DAOM BR117]
MLCADPPEVKNECQSSCHCEDLVQSAETLGTETNLGSPITLEGYYNDRGEFQSMGQETDELTSCISGDESESPDAQELLFQMMAELQRIQGVLEPEACTDFNPTDSPGRAGCKPDEHVRARYNDDHDDVVLMDVDEQVDLEEVNLPPSSTKAKRGRQLSSTPKSSQNHRRMMEAASKKKNVLEAMYKERSKCQIIEKELQAVTSKVAIRADILQCVGDVWSRSLEEMKLEKAQLSTRIEQIRHNVQKLWQYVQAPKPGNAYISSLKQLMETIEAGILVFKNTERERYEQVLQQEKKLTQELACAEDHINSWGQQQDESATITQGKDGRSQPKRAAANNVHTEGTLLPEAIAYQNFLARHGGPYGGWEDVTHNAFVKLRQKHFSNTNAFLQACVSKLPGITIEMASAHEAWYESFLRVSEERKMAIARWKQSKAVSAEKNVQMKAETESGKKERTKGDTQRNRAMRDRQKEILACWKSQKQAEKEEAERIKQEELQRAKEEQKRWREEQRNLRDRVSIYVQKRSETRSLQQKLDEEAERQKKKFTSLLVAEEAKRLAQKNAELLQQRREAVTARVKKEEERTKRLERLREQVAVDVPRDPSRILRPTEAFQNKVEGPHEDATEKVKDHFKPVILPRRHIPDWRRGL